MATYQSPLVLNKVPVPSHGLGNTMKVQRSTVTCAAAPTTADTIQFFTMPKNSVLLGFEIVASQMDTNGSPTLAFNVGDAGSATRLFTAVPAGRLVAPQWRNETDTTATSSGMGYQFPADTLLVAVPSANAATGAAGTITLNVYYVVVGGPS